MQLILFDIDGTLIRSGGAGKAAMERALAESFALKSVWNEVLFSGRTDPAITVDLMLGNGIEPTLENVAKFHSRYLEHLPATLESIGGEVLPGIADLLQLLSNRDDVTIGLFTGNMRAGAEAKLKYFDLWHHFPFGGFADDTPSRDDIARNALRLGIAHVGKEVALDRVWVVGDTPHDVTCARAIGAKVVAVGTGWHPLDELHATNADLVLADLADPEPWFAMWRSE